MKFTPEEQADLEAMRGAVEENFAKISDSSVFCVLFGADMSKDPACLLQMGLAVYLDKPIFLLVPTGTLLPGNLRAMAARVVEYEKDVPGSLEAAIRELAEFTAKGSH